MRRILAVILLLGLSWGCSGGQKNTRSALSPPDENWPAQPDQRTMEHLGTQVDSAAALYAIGDIQDFMTARDSLAASLEAIALAYPEIREEPEFIKVLSSIYGLDSLLNVHRYVEETDSLALSVEPWPEDTTETRIVGTFESGNSVFPILSNDRIDFWIRYYTGPGRERFERSVYRMQLYQPIVEEILEELDLPTELICVALIESGFVLKARSNASAVGPWQFIAGTARLYGLRVSWWYDERRDVIASTYAAGNYLSDLYGIWESWPLALASYNCGEYRVARAVARHRTEDFWKLDLPRQTERYVPKFLATLYLLQDPDKYGFNFAEAEPVKFDRVSVRDAIDLKVVAKSAGSSVKLLKDLNPALLRWCTPPRMEIELKVPVGAGEITAEKLKNIPPEEQLTWRKHKIRRGESLSSIAGKYGTSVQALKDLNGIRNRHRIRAGKYLIVPVPGSTTELAGAVSKPEYKTTHRNLDKEALAKYAQKSVAPANYQRTRYTVKKGDTLGEIAEWYRTSARNIRRWNNLSYRSYIYPGQRLTIYVRPSIDLASIEGTTKKVIPSGDGWVKREYRVRKGDTFYGISKKFSVELSDLLAWNKSSTRSVLYAGQKLEIWEKRE